MTTDPSNYSAVQGGHKADFSYLEKDDRWLYIQWPGPHFQVDNDTLCRETTGEEWAGRYRITVDPEDGTILFVDEEDDVRQVIDERNLLVLIKRSLRIKTAGQPDHVKAGCWEVDGSGCTCPGGWSSSCTTHGAKAPVPGVSH